MALRSLPMPCLDDNLIVSFSQGGLTGAELVAVEKHFDACPECAALACEAVRALAEDGELGESTAGGSSASMHHPPIAAGDRLGRYIVLRTLGFGGMGEVYAAFDPELDRRVAIKLLKWHVEATLSPRARSRIVREAKALAKLSHPNVVSIHDIGFHEGRVFIAMEHIVGQTLLDWVRREARPWQKVRDVLVAAGRGLQAAHEAGIIHRDFKPANLLIGVDGRVCVLDFGLACATERDDSGILAVEVEASAETDPPRFDETVTSVGETVGTPAYMAPEQLAGLLVDARADQFGFCVTAFEALYGRRPVHDGAMLLTSAPEARGAVPSFMFRALVRGLASDPAERHPSMQALLHAMLEDERSRKRQWSVLFSAVALSATLSGSAVFLVRPEPTPAEREAIAERVADARTAAEDGYFVYPPLEQPNRPTAYRQILDLEQLEGPAAEVAIAEAATLRRELSAVLTHLGDLYWTQEGGRPFAADYYAAAALFDPSNTHAQARCSLTLPELASFRAAVEDGAFGDAELHAGAALAALAELDERKRERKLQALASRHSSGRPLSMELHLQRLVGGEPGISSARAQPVEQPPAAPEAEASEKLTAVPVATETPAASKAPTVARSRSPRPSRVDRRAASDEVQLGRAHLRSGRLQEAETHFHRALQHDSASADALHGLSEVHFERGAFGNAITFGEAAISRAPTRGDLRLVLGDAYFKARRYDEARRHYEEAEALGERAAVDRLRLLDAKLGR